MLLSNCVFGFFGGFARFSQLKATIERPDVFKSQDALIFSYFTFPCIRAKMRTEVIV